MLKTISVAVKKRISELSYKIDALMLSNNQIPFKLSPIVLVIAFITKETSPVSCQDSEFESCVVLMKENIHVCRQF